MLYLLCFILGVVFGVVIVVIHAHQPNGFKANNGRRYRLTELKQ